MNKLTVPDFENVDVLVAGDLMLDRYWFGHTGRISPEAPVPVVRVDQLVEKPGGAGNVAVNIVTLGARCTVVGITGADDEAVALERSLKQSGIAYDVCKDDGFSTITKLRVVSRQQQLLRLDFEREMPESAVAPFVDTYRNNLDAANVVILSDYAKGTLGNVARLIDMARKAGKPVLVDPKGADFSRYRGATVLTPNFTEFEKAAGGCVSEEDLEAKAHALRESLDIDALLITRSEKGMSLFQRSGETVHLPAEAREVFDVTGAGDTVIALLAAAMASGLPVIQAARMANLGAGIVVARFGAASVTASELQVAARRNIQNAHRVVNESELLSLIANARKNGESIVMTNGCFDILHAGHVAYLKEASLLGDRLVVAVNDDASVRNLKGAQRPVLPLQQRMQVLAGLESVDWVLPFSGETPEKLICKVLPDLLVKGGDYRPEDVAGFKCVTENGGSVQVLQFHDGFSTSSIIGKLRDQ